MKNFYHIQVIDLRYQVDNITHQKMQLFEEFRGATNEASLFVIIFRHREIEMFSDGKNSPQLKLFK